MRSRGVTGARARVGAGPSEKRLDAPPPRSAELALSPLPGVRPPAAAGAGVRTSDALVTFAGDFLATEAGDDL